MQAYITPHVEWKLSAGDFFLASSSAPFEFRDHQGQKNTYSQKEHHTKVPPARTEKDNVGHGNLHREQFSNLSTRRAGIIDEKQRTNGVENKDE
jgi:hypothetical protein